MANIHKTLLHTMLRSYGVTGARLDYHKPDGCIYLTYCAQGNVKYLALPTGVPVTTGELVDLLFGGALPAEPTAAAGAPKPAPALSG